MAPKDNDSVNVKSVSESPAVATVGGPSTSAVGDKVDGLTDSELNERKVKALKKKLRQIDEIEDKVKLGQSITTEQEEKLSKKGELEAELILLQS